VYLSADAGMRQGHRAARPSQRRRTEAELVRQALRRGLRYERLLTDMVLQLRHPERRGAPLRRTEVELWREWRTVRDQLVRPMLRRSPPAMMAQATPLGGWLGQGGQLRQFQPKEVVLDDAETLAVLRFFWPGRERELRAMTVTTADRAFAQALMVEAADASLTMGVMETVYRRFFGRVPRSFGSIASSMLKVLRKAVHNRWLRSSKEFDAAKVKIYENVRATLARNFRSVLELRLQTGELVY
jgi:hypothetical protein